MTRSKIAFISDSKADTSLVEAQLDGLDYEMELHVCSSPGETIEAIKGADLIISQRVAMPREVIEAIDTAQAIVSFGHGFDQTDHNAATERGVMLVNMAGFTSEAVANHTMMLLLASARKLTYLHDTVRRGGWDTGIHQRLLPMPQILGQVLGLVGLGNIARSTARKAQAFGMNVIAYDPYTPPWVATEYRVELVAGLDELASRSDFVSMHTPLNDETRKMIGEAFFKAMKPSAYFINTCRGPTVDEKALVRALEANELAGAGLDVFEEEPTPANNPLLNMDNVTVTPHSAGTSDLVFDDADVRAGEEAARIISGTWPMSLVNPEVRSKLAPRPPAVNVTKRKPESTEGHRWTA